MDKGWKEKSWREGKGSRLNTDTRRASIFSGEPFRALQAGCVVRRTRTKGGVGVQRISCRKLGVMQFRDIVFHPLIFGSLSPFISILIFLTKNRRIFNFFFFFFRIFVIFYYRNSRFYFSPLKVKIPLHRKGKKEERRNCP